MKKIMKRSAALSAAVGLLAVVPVSSANADVVSCAKYEAGALAHHVLDGGPTPMPCAV